MAEKFRSLLLVSMILAVGGFLGSMVDQWALEDEEDLPEDTVAIPNLPHPDLGRVRVEVLNAGGVPGMASRATDHLRESGFDVVYYGNASHFGQRNTVVIDRSGRREFTEAVAEALGVKFLADSLDIDRFLDVTVILGESWELYPQEEGSSQTELELPWWNIRKYMP